MLFKVLNKVLPDLNYLLLQGLRKINVNNLKGHSILFILEFPECFNSFGPLIRELVKKNQEVLLYVYKEGYIDSNSRSELDFPLPKEVRLLKSLPDRAHTIVLHNPYDVDRHLKHSFYRLYIASHRICFISYGIEVAGGRVATHYKLPAMRYSDIVLTPSERIRSNHLKYSKISLNKERLLKSQHPYMYDVNSRLVRKNMVCDIFYSTHHSVDVVNDLCTFAKYGHIFHNLFRKHQQLKILFRPHPLFLQKVSTTEYFDLFNNIISLNNVTLSVKNDFIDDILCCKRIITDVSSMIPVISSTKKDLLILTNAQFNAEDSVYTHQEFTESVLEKFITEGNNVENNSGESFYEEFTILDELCAE